IRGERLASLRDGPVDDRQVLFDDRNRRLVEPSTAFGQRALEIGNGGVVLRVGEADGLIADLKVRTTGGLVRAALSIRTAARVALSLRAARRVVQAFRPAREARDLPRNRTGDRRQKNRRGRQLRQRQRDAPWWACA